MEQTLYEIGRLLIIWLMGFVFFCCTFYPVLFYFERKLYKFPKFFTLLLISFASAAGTYGLVLCITMIIITSYILPFARADIFGISLGMALFASVLAPVFFIDLMKKPRHDQKQFVELSENLSLAEIKKIIREKFPNTELSSIGISFGFPDEQYVLRFLPYNFSHFIEYEDGLETKVYYPHSLGLAIKAAETKDPEMKKSKFFFSNGELYISTEKT